MSNFPFGFNPGPADDDSGHVALVSVSGGRSVARLDLTAALLNQPGSTYPLPPFYKRLFNGIDPVISEEDKFRVHAERIGDYTISLCA